MSLHWAVLGTSRTAQKRTLPAMLRAGHRIVAIAGRSAERCAEFQQIFEIPSGRPWEEAEDIIDSPDVDAVYIPLPNAMHSEWVVR